MAISFQSSNQTPVKVSSDPYNDENSDILSEQMPPVEIFTSMTSDDFLRQNRHIMLKEEIDELSDFPIIYYAGSIPDRQPGDLELIKIINQERIAVFN